MTFYILLGLISAIGLVIGILALRHGNKACAVTQCVFAVLLPVSVALWCTKKGVFAVGGSDWSFFYETIAVDKMMQPTLIAFLYLCFLGLAVYNVITIIQKKK